MGVSPAVFQSAGKISQHYIPGAYSRIDSVKGNSGSVSTNNGVIMGRSSGGKPATLLAFTTLGDAIATLKSGPLMDAVRLAFNPGNGLVPQKLYAMRVNTATQSTLSLKDGSANNMLTISSADYGMDTTQIKLKVEAGTTGKKVTIAYKGSTETYDNMIQNSFTIQYATGACTMTIVNTNAAQTLTSSAGGLSIDLNTYPTLGSLVSFINTQTGFTATVSSGQDNASSLNLDAIATQDINTAPYTAQSTLQYINDVINQNSLLVVSAIVNATHGRAIPANISYTFLSGGTEGTYTSTEWSAALTALEAEDVQFVSTPDATGSVQAAIETHCALMSAVTGRKERQGFYGGLWGDSVATATAQAKVLNSSNGSIYAYNGGTQYDVNGNIVQYGASYAACMMMGMACAAAINMPLTFKTMNFISLEHKLSISTMETLIQNGVAPINYSPSGVPRIVRQVTTSQGSDLKYCEFSIVREMFFVSRDLRNYLEDIYAGQPGNVNLDVIKGVVAARLQDYVTAGVFTVGNEGAFWAIIILMSGDQIKVDYDANLTSPINFMFITNHFHTVASTTAA
jgi:hypothetical protein